MLTQSVARPSYEHQPHGVEHQSQGVQHISQDQDECADNEGLPVGAV